MKSTATVLKKIQTLIQQNKFKQAIKTCDSMLKTNRNSFDASVSKANLLAETGFHKKSLSYYYKAPKIIPGDVVILNNKGIVFAGKSKHKEAIKCFDAALMTNSVDLDTLCNKGNSLAELGDFKNAATCFESALEIDSKDYDACFRLGVVLSKFLHLERLKQLS